MGLKLRKDSAGQSSTRYGPDHVSFLRTRDGEVAILCKLLDACKLGEPIKLINMQTVPDRFVVRVLIRSVIIQLVCIVKGSCSQRNGALENRRPQFLVLGIGSIPHLRDVIVAAQIARRSEVVGAGDMSFEPVYS